MATNQEKLDRIAQIDEAVDVQVNAKNGALQTLRRSLNTAGPAGLIACQGDVNIILARVDALSKAVAGIPTAVLNQQFTLPDGTNTNLAGILAQLDAKPAATAAVAQVDVDALAEKLTAALPPAFISALAVKLSQP